MIRALIALAQIYWMDLVAEFQMVHPGMTDIAAILAAPRPRNDYAAEQHIAWMLRVGAAWWNCFTPSAGSGLASHVAKIRWPPSSSMSLTPADFITSACILRPAWWMRRVISCFAFATSGCSSSPG